MMICFDKEEWEQIQTKLYDLNGLIDQLFVTSWRAKENSIMECNSTLTTITKDVITIQKKMNEIKDLV